MKFWIDAQLPPSLAPWLTQRFSVTATAVRDLGLRDVTDEVIFRRARSAEVVMISKDFDFVEMVTRYGAPPQLRWVTCGNLSNERLRQVFESVFEKAQQRLAEGSDVVELADAAPAGSVSGRFAAIAPSVAGQITTIDQAQRAIDDDDAGDMR